MEVDFSAQIKARNISFASKPIKFDGFKLSDKAKTFLASKSPTQVEILASVAQNGFEAAKNFFRPSVSDLEYTIARVNSFIKSGNPSFLTSSLVDMGDLEFSLARVTIAEYRLSEADFKEVKAEVKVIVEDDPEDGETCDCEDPEMEDSGEGKKVCAKCGKPAKAKKNC